MPKEKKNINIASEPEAAYEKKMIQRFYSFEERDKDRLKGEILCLIIAGRIIKKSETNGTYIFRHYRRS